MTDRYRNTTRQFCAAMSIILIGLAAACSDWKPKTCRSGRGCPPNAQCAESQDICITTNCGNGIVDGHEGEVCDDGNIISGDGCRADCLSHEICGNGLLDEASGEECDTAGESDRCDTDCSFASCGDGTLNTAASEQCDTAGESTQCNEDCTLAFCGDGVVNESAAEQCDTTGESAGCDIDCSFASCGDGTTNRTSGENCDDGGDSPSCDADCTPSVCGDSFPNTAAGEQCDSGGNNVADCDADCTVPVCGDSLLNPASGEACDGGGLDTAGCDQDCTFPQCGDGYLNYEIGEICDYGIAGNNNYGECTEVCLNARCGDGFVNQELGIEECDDHDELRRGNGCDDHCKFTDGFLCAGDDMIALGMPGRDTGLSVRVVPFQVDHFQPTKMITIGKPPGSSHLAFPTVSTYFTHDADPFEWDVAMIENHETNSFNFTISISRSTDSSRISGFIYVFGFDTMNSVFACGAQQLTVESIEQARTPVQPLETKAKVIALPNVWSYQTRGDENFGWRITSPPSDLTTCSHDFTLEILHREIVLGGPPDYGIGWQACLLSLAETIRVEKRSFTAVSNRAQVVFEFNIDRNFDQVYIPVITQYNEADDEDIDYEVDCFDNGFTLSCYAGAAGDNNEEGFIEGYVLLLESERGFL